MAGDTNISVSDNNFRDGTVNIAKKITNYGLPESQAGSQLLREQLGLLREELERRGGGTASTAASAVADAEKGVADHDPSATKLALSKAGTFALDCAKEIGTHLAEAALQAALHISG